ncbi:MULTISPECIES: hypothetical protein [Bradyrhizobium]|uniref:Oligosaccharide repeat unit polymerase n=1 Tax=Bradyrhizobium ottawaense TaxID=931866 RepID=A0ABV4G724_9BRAD|nr:MULTISPECIES: hypothetical protein [Bradyrhizobium]MBR1294552.1 hypothetical protein [Bradyrhizobium ottawaense]MDA9454372.1 hypothetical protein [Bradyrhizobium sp. CCBAU 21359]WLB43931.1 hypothetical protein QIH93_25750 [Bradyrhizobium ottawaense]BBO11194.1 hypothetical protein TM102_26640 [Bradyrhizobium sp. TM102]GMO33304.1 hypothetical protein BwSF12_32590 [Bradyrhizobium ottawaense]
MTISDQFNTSQAPLLALLAIHTVACCVSLAVVLQLYGYLHLFSWNVSHIGHAVLLALPVVAVGCMMAFARFSFGYLLSFYVYTAVLGYVCLTPFSKLEYDHSLPVFSAIISAAAFLVPTLFLRWPIKPRHTISVKTLRLLIAAIAAVTLAIVATGVFYNFKLVGFTDIYQFRDELRFPPLLQYAMGIALGALLPFAFACCIEMRARTAAVAILLLFVALYPVTLTKTALFAPAWLGLLWFISTRLEPRVAVIVSLLGPIALGVVLAILSEYGPVPRSIYLNYFGTINFRMIAYPSIALDVYNDFFSRHDLTHFCQISVIKRLVTCPYSEQLSLVIAKSYPAGNLNASFLATEGVASVGSILAPASALLAGLILSIGNHLSEGLPPRFIILSSAMVTQIFLNVPLSVLMITNGAAILFLLWYVLPRHAFADLQHRSTS